MTLRYSRPGECCERCHKMVPYGGEHHDCIEPLSGKMLYEFYRTWQIEQGMDPDSLPPFDRLTSEDPREACAWDDLVDFATKVLER